jgi:para-nitrobenzyl esterase
MKMKQSVLWVGVSLLLGACSGMPGGSLPAGSGNLDVVTTDGGAVRGKGGEVRAFLGIPYAAAPTGENRWRAPKPAAKWTGVRDGSAFGPDCMQPAEYPELRGAGMSEDCLSVNVWSPARRSNEKLPVMVWIYGGGFTYGSGSHPSYDGEALAQRGVVVITLNYRLGLLGFMAHPELTAESGTQSSGNYGLLDQIAALKWVQRNVEAFGGDARKVTVFGQSAGAHSISTLIAAPMAEGLFQQAIMQSVGVMRPMASLKDAEAYGASFGTSVKALRAVPAAELVERLKNAPVRESQVTAARTLSIVADNLVVRQPDYQAYGRGQFQRIPVLVGNVSNEGGGAVRNLPVKTTADLDRYVAHNFPGLEGRARQVYGTSQDAQVPQALADVYSDVQFLFGSREMLRADNRYGVPAYRYVFSRHRNDAAAAPIHGDELQFGFDNLRALHRGRMRPFNATDEQVARSMADAWVRFAKTGSPAGGDVAAWRPYDAASQAYMNFGDTPAASTGFASARLDLVRDYYANQRR